MADDPKVWDFAAVNRRIRLTMQSFLRGQASDPVLATASISDPLPDGTVRMSGTTPTKGVCDRV